MERGMIITEQGYTVNNCRGTFVCSNCRWFYTVVMTAITEFFTQETTQETTSKITQETTRKTTLILRLKWHNLPEKEYKNRRGMMNFVDFIPSRGHGSVVRKMLYAKWLACVRLPLMLIEERSADGSCVLGIVQKKNYPEKKVV